MEILLDGADSLVSGNPTNASRPDFEVPKDFDSETAASLMETATGDLKGIGWVAKVDIEKPGTILLVEKALAMVMDDEAPDEEPVDFNDSDEYMSGTDDDESKVNQILLLDLLKGIKEKPEIWTNCLSKLFPRTDESIARLPAWVCRDDEVFVEVEKIIEDMANAKVLSREVTKEIAKRLPLIIRYNVLSIETCPELLTHPGPDGHSTLSGMGLFHLASFFNHSSQPNVSRFAVGNIMWFVTNQSVKAGTELCISYLEHDVLCESPSRRTNMLGRDFTESDDQDVEGDSGPDLPVVDSQVQNELMAMNPLERLDSLKNLLQQAKGLGLPEEATPESSQGPWFQCDVQNLQIIQAITLDGLGQAREALGIWEQCVEFTERKLPPNDEASVVMRVQAAICAQRAGDLDRAKMHSAKALQTHNIVFGGGLPRFLRRYARELKLTLRPESDDVSDPEDLWKLD